MDEAPPPLPSQASSHFPLEPVSGATLFEQEVRRRDALARCGTCLTGCRELDDEVLLGGFERGCVVGVSAEEEEVGLLIGLQTVARLFVASLGTGQSQEPRAMIITTLSVDALLPLLRDTFKAQLVAQKQDPGKGNELLKRFLERISISRIFDVSGLWEAVRELDSLAPQDEAHQEPPSSQQAVEDEVTTGPRAVSTEGRDVQEGLSLSGLSSSPLSDPPSSLPDELEFEEAVPRTTPPGKRTEIADSEDEGDLSSPVSLPKASPEPETVPQTVSEEEISKEESSTKQPSIDQPGNQKDSRHPDIILVTHMSTLLSALFRQREKDTAHQMLQLLSSHLRYLARSPDHGGPLIMTLNSTTNSTEGTAAPNTKPNPGQGRPSPQPPPPTEAPNTRSSNRPLDPTLRSIFNPPPLPTTGLGYAHDTPLARRNKPSFGLIFTQLLDIHLLCTRVPKTRADAEALFAPPSQAAALTGAVDYGWVVEVLLDEVGVWDSEGGRRGARRASREQRWGAVGVRRDGNGVRVVDAFGSARKPAPEIVLAAGFGGRRV
ncbi:fasciclin domain family [Diaporthe amygdali]|uniref:fasciclin domain family n=1 Tax=Phomopsis amygdali TaxID=1214568 RepID=UPI0022FE1510|nr:fasciclin domain family [Diaporthe amygdali]KAJ0123516.1 fasciclin domain family [Diaporthe amygdali]